MQQRDLLDAAGLREDFKPANKLPYDFYYKFADNKGRETRRRILDWETGMLYRNCLKGAHGKEDEALEKVRILLYVFNLDAPTKQAVELRL